MWLQTFTVESIVSLLWNNKTHLCGIIISKGVKNKTQDSSFVFFLNFHLIWLMHIHSVPEGTIATDGIIILFHTVTT